MCIQNKKKDAGLWLAKLFWDPPRDVQVELADFWCGTLWSIGGPQGGMWKLTDPSKGVLQYQLRGFFGHHCHTLRARIPGNDHGDLRLTPKHILGVRGPWGHFHFLTQMAVFGRFWPHIVSLSLRITEIPLVLFSDPQKLKYSRLKTPWWTLRDPRGPKSKMLRLGPDFFSMSLILGWQIQWYSLFPYWYTRRLDVAIRGPYLDLN